MTVNGGELRDAAAGVPARGAEPARPRVIVCDDSSTTRALFRSLLAGRHELLLAASGEEVLERGAAFAPDVILCDLLLPGLSGAEICRRARLVPALADVPFVLVTSVADTDARADALEAGADDYLTKPIRERELLARVASLVRLRREVLRGDERLRALGRANAALASAQAALVRSERLAGVGALAAGLAHELAGPLASIRAGSAELLGQLDEVNAASFEVLARVADAPGLRNRLLRARTDASESAARVADASRRLERVARDLGVFTAPPLGPEELVGPAEAIEAAWALARGGLARVPTLEREVEPGEPLLATRALVVQPLTAVLEHAMAAAGPVGRVSVRVRQLPGGVEIAVRHPGTAIPRAEAPRLHTALDGPGLAVARGIVHGLGGDLAVESSPGEGATFRLRFPRRPGALGRAPEAARSETE